MSVYIQCSNDKVTIYNKWTLDQNQIQKDTLMHAGGEKKIKNIKPKYYNKQW